MKFTKRRRVVEIYFILYLAALIFLLPDRKDSQHLPDTDTKVFQLPFSLQPEKAALICRMVIDSTGPAILSIDSVNTIFYSGNVRDVEFEFTVIDESVQGSLELNADKPLSRNFRMEELTGKQAASFIWSPPENVSTNKTYIVKVKARALPTEEMKSSGIAGNSLEYQTQFSLNILFVSDTSVGSGNLAVAPQSGFNPLGIPNIFGQVPALSGDFSLVALYPKIEEIASGYWTNSVYAKNIDLKRDVLRGPLITVKCVPENNGGFAQLLEMRSDELVLRGKTPLYGTMNVEIRLTRKKDIEGMSREYMTSFKVQPKMIEQPKYDKFMYPDMAYEINPRLPLMGRAAKAYLKVDNVVRAQSQGERFTFTPDVSDIGRVAYLERYIDTMLLDRNKITIMDFPDPDVVNLVEINSDTVQVVTRSYGYFNKAFNEVVYFIVEGNAKFKDLRGFINYNRKDNNTIQYFIFTAKDLSKPLRFTIRAVDKRGRTSLVKRYDG